MMFIALVFGLLSADTMPLEDFYFKHFQAIATDENSVFFSVTSASKPLLARFDWETGELRVSDDNRIAIMFVHTLTRYQDQLLVFDMISRQIVRLDRQLFYLSKRNFSEIDWADLGAFTPRFAHTESSGDVLITFQRPEDRGQIALGRLEPETMSVTLLAHKTIDGKEEGYWLPAGKRLLFVYVNRGRIDIMNPTNPGKRKETIFRGIEPVEKKRYRGPRRPPFHWVVEYPIVFGDEVHWIWNRVRDQDGRERDNPLFDASVLRWGEQGMSLRETKIYPIARSREQILAIDWEEHRLVQLTRNP